MFGNNKTTKTIKIDGMSCEHCSKKVEMALKGIKEVKSAKVDLTEKKAEVILKENIDENILKSVVEDLGYEVKEIK